MNNIYTLNMSDPRFEQNLETLKESINKKGEVIISSSADMGKLVIITNKIKDNNNPNESSNVSGNGKKILHD